MLIGSNFELVEIPYSFFKLLLKYKKRYEEVESVVFNDNTDNDEAMMRLLDICLRDDVIAEKAPAKKTDADCNNDMKEDQQ